MNSAQDKYTGAIVEAEELWLIENVDHDRYVCRGCGIKVTPASYRPENVVRPYFTTRDGDHKSGCDVDGETKLVSKGRKGRVSTPRHGFPSPYPSRLVLRNERYVVGDCEPVSERANSEKNTAKSSEGIGAALISTHRRAANSIRPICRTFINFPFDRDLELTIPGIDTATYRSVFKKLKWDELIFYPKARLFYAAIRWNKPVDTEDYLEVLLDAGERGDNKRLLRGYRIRVQWAEWSKAKRAFVRNEIEAARKEAIKASNENPKSKGYLFFIGQQSPDDVGIFLVTDHRLICCLVDEITYPETNT